MGEVTEALYWTFPAFTSSIARTSSAARSAARQGDTGNISKSRSQGTPRSSARSWLSPRNCRSCAAWQSAIPIQNFPQINYTSPASQSGRTWFFSTTNPRKPSLIPFVRSYCIARNVGRQCTSPCPPKTRFIILILGAHLLREAITV